MDNAIYKQNTLVTMKINITLKEHIAKIIRQYFSNLKGETPINIYDFFLDEVQEPLLKIVMQYTRKNQSETARILGISRGTLRIMLKKYGML